jgi:D-alanyl-D-alanine carboxypeptidase/D-alanyl-D-alanine-endopeptidase (penicillin-binding protein 4)
VLDLLGGLFALFFHASPKLEPLQATNWSAWHDPDWVQSLVAPSPDPAAQTAIQQHIAALASMGFPSTNQAVWMQTGHQVLGDYQGTTPIPAASLTKIATTFAALTTWGPSHQFETTFSTNAPVQAGVLQGDLFVQAGGDPLFIWEEAIAVGNALNQAGIRQIKGNLIVSNNFVMNFETDPLTSGNLLKQALNSALWSGEIETQYQKLLPAVPRPQVVIQGGVQVAAIPQQTKLILRHQSLPLVHLLKAMNIYSNNVMAQMMADSVGGAAAVAQRATELTKLPPEEIQMVNGSGLGTENRLSPRAIATLLIATQRYLQARQLTIADIYPVVGRDGGTLEGRQTPPGTVVKTGTLNEVSALAGVMPTRERGLVWFAIVNLGLGDIKTFHSQQDLLLTKLQQSWGGASLTAVLPTPQPDDLNRLGATVRNQLLSQQLSQQ